MRVNARSITYSDFSPRHAIGWRQGIGVNSNKAGISSAGPCLFFDGFKY